MKEKIFKSKVIVVDDDRDFLQTLVTSPILLDKWEVIGFTNAEEALRYLTRFDDVLAVLLDYDLQTNNPIPQKNGLELLEFLQKSFPDVKVIMISGITKDRGQVAIKALENFAYTFLDKPFKISDLVDILEKISQSENVDQDAELSNLLAKLKDFGFITTNIYIALQIKRALKTYNSENISILIYGPSGTGKTLLAKAFHKMSNYSYLPIYESHTASYSTDVNMFRSHLFGHKKGSFTGASFDKKGLFETNGSIILDDIHHLPLDCQKSLLQVLQTRIFTKVGEEYKERIFDGKIIATSTLSRAEMIQNGMLKEFVTRIAGDEIYIPPLKERPEDIPFLIDHFISKSSKPNVKFHPLLIQKLSHLPWDEGNARDLEMVVRRLVIHSETDEINVQNFKEEFHLPLKIEKSNLAEIVLLMAEENGLEKTLEELRKTIILKELALNNWNISEVAKKLKCSNHSVINYWLRKWKIDPFSKNL